MALKGVCEIQLKDVDGNVVQETKDYNMVTNGLDRIININAMELFKITGDYNSFKHITKCFKMIRNVVGGCLLFNQTLEEDVNNIVPPVDKIVASGSLAKIPLSNSKIGNWNIVESQVIYNSKGELSGFKFVWDFPTDKGNGTIKSVSLTTDEAARWLCSSVHILHKTTGGNGLDRPYNLIDPIKEKIEGNQVDASCSDAFDSYYSSFPGLIGSTMDGSLIVIVNGSSSQKSITISKKKEKPFIKIDDGYLGEKTYTDDIVKTFNLTDLEAMTMSFNSTYYFGLLNGITYLHKNKIYIGFGYNNKISLKIIDANTLEEIETLNRTFTGGGINVFDKSNLGYTPLPIFAYNGHYIFNARDEGKDYIYIVKDSDLTIVTKELITSGNDSALVTFPYSGGFLNDMLYISARTRSDKASGSCYCINKDLTIIKSALFWESTLPLEFPKFEYPLMMYKYQYKYVSSSSPFVSSTKLGPNPAVSANVLFTIDNLATPVTKTASQTMKVIYTIQDVEEEVV